MPAIIATELKNAFPSGRIFDIFMERGEMIRADAVTTTPRVSARQPMRVT